MRAITVRQPWAWAIIHGGKDVENRSRNVAGSYRGPVAIHAGLAHADLIDNQGRMVASAVGRLSRARQSQGMDMVPSLAGSPNVPNNWVHERFGHRGAIIGLVDLVDVHHWSECLEGVFGCSPWAMSDCHHLVLKNPRALVDPIPARGQLGLWRLDAGLEAQLSVRFKAGE